MQTDRFKIVLQIFAGLLGLALLFSSAAFGQEVQHAPTKDVCQADVAVWYNPEMSAEYNNAQGVWARDHVPNRTALAKMPLHEVLGRMDEMYSCEQVDEQRNDLYHSAGNMYFGIYADRAINFIYRHHLMQQFRQEDAAGAR